MYSQPQYQSPPTPGQNGKTFSILSWLVFPPIGSIVFLFLTKDDPDAKFNAANATVVHGFMLVVYIVLLIVTTVIHFLSFVVGLWDLLWVVVWLIGWILAIQNNGRRFAFPVLTDSLKQFIPTVENLAA